MAVRRRPDVLRGGLAHWLTLDEVREIVEAVTAVDTAYELTEWAYSAPWQTSIPYATEAGRRALYGGEDRPLTEADRDAAVSLAVMDIAARRRDEAIRASGGFASCPVCDAPIAVYAWPHDGGFYCTEHGLERDTEIARLTIEAGKGT